jgi:uncharacterized protein (TIGR03435 family)
MKTIALLLIASGTIAAQPAPATCAVVSPEAAKMEFDAISVKPADPRGGATGLKGGPGSNDPGRITTLRIAPAYLIFIAYDLWSDQLQGPAWITNDRGHLFSISATMPATTTKEQYCGMLRNLLAERFHLTFHHETQPRPGYELTVLPGGPKFQQYVPGPSGAGTGPTAGTDANGFVVMPPNEPISGGQLTSPSGLAKLSYRNTMAKFARFIGAQMSPNRGGASNEPQPRIADKTGLAGSWDVRLEYQIPPLNPNAPSALDGAAQANTPEGASIFAAVQQQPGLKLQKVKDVPIDVLIVDHIDQTATEN